MERLWTPWRLDYVAKGGETADDECFLCRYSVAPSERDEEHLVLVRTEQALVTLNLYPYNTGHLMVAPLVHVADLSRLAPDAGHALWDLTRQAVAILEREYAPSGFNVGMNLGRTAGAGLPGHLHLHVVPRWEGDTNFMPVTGDTKVLPEALEQTYRRLRPHFDGP